MPRYVKQSENRWLHNNYKKAYCFRYRNGMVYTCIDSVRQATGYEWLPKNKKVCLSILNDRLIAMRKGNNADLESKDVKSLVNQFSRDKLSKLNPKTQYQYKLIFNQFFKINYQLSQINEIRMSILNIINQNHDKLASNTIWKRLQRLRKIFDYGIELEWIDKNPVTESMIPSFIKKKVVICTEEHVNLLIKYFKDKKQDIMGEIIHFDYITGLRIQEIIDLKWSEINDRYMKIKGKGDRSRVFPIKPFKGLSETIKNIKKLSPEKPGHYKSQETLRKFLNEAEEKLNEQYPEMDFKSITFHTIRKTAINRWRRMGIDADTRNYLAGHSKNVEKDFYLTNPDIELLEQQLSKI